MLSASIFIRFQSFWHAKDTVLGLRYVDALHLSWIYNVDDPTECSKQH